MKIIVERNDLERALSGATKVIHGREVSILNCALLTVEGSTLTVRATDTDTIITRHVEAKVSSAGVAAVEALKLSAIAGNIPQGAQVELTRKGDVLTLRSGRSRFTLACLDDGAFPPTMTIGAEAFFLDGDELARSLKTAAIAASRDADRIYLRGVLWENVEGRLCLTASDGARLHSSTFGRDIPAFPRVVVPGAAGDLIAALATDHDTVSAAITDRLIEVKAGGSVIRSKLIDGTFPDWRRIVNRAENGPTIRVSRTSLLAAVKRVLPLAEANKSGQFVYVRPDKGFVTVIGMVSNAADCAVDHVDAEVKGEFPGAAFFARLLTDALTVVSGDEVTLRTGPLTDNGINLYVEGEKADDIILVNSMIKSAFPAERIAALAA